MKSLLQIELREGQTLREIDASVENAALCGYGGLVLPPCGEQTLQGFCRSAYRHGVRLWLSDDFAAVSGAFGGEVTSVPEFRPRELFRLERGEERGDDLVLRENDGGIIVARVSDGFWGADFSDPDAVEAFLESFYVPLKRNAARFVGHEIVGVVTRFAANEGALPYSERLEAYINKTRGLTVDELFRDGETAASARKAWHNAAGELFAENVLKRLHRFCGEKGLLLAGLSPMLFPSAATAVDVTASENPDAGANMLFADWRGLSPAKKLNRASRAFAAGAQCLAVKADKGIPRIERALCAAIDRLTSLAEDTPPLPTADKSGYVLDKGNDKLYFFFNDDDNSVRLETEIVGQGYVLDTVSGDIFAAREGKMEFTLESGGSLALLCGGEKRQALPLPPFTRAGAVFAEPSRLERLEFKLERLDENVLLLSDETPTFEAEYVADNFRVEADDATCVRLNGREAVGGKASSSLHLGHNVLETDGKDIRLCGDFSTDGKRVLPPSELKAGDVRIQGLPAYGGRLLCEAVLPDDCGGKYLSVKGSFGALEIKIGRRKELLFNAPWAVPLYGTDEGRTVDISACPTCAHDFGRYGVDEINIVEVVK